METKKRKVVFVLLIVSVFLYLVASLMGIAQIGTERYYDWRYSISGSTYTIRYFIFGLYSYQALGYIFVPIMGGMLLILVPLTIAYYSDKLRFIKLHKFMSAVDFFILGGCALAQAVLMYMYAYYMTAVGIIVNLLFWSLAVVSLVACVFCIVDFISLFKVKVVEFVEKRQAVKDSDTAVEKLRMLKQLLDEHAITEQEYNEKKKKYVDLL